MNALACDNVDRLPSPWTIPLPDYGVPGQVVATRTNPIANQAFLIPFATPIAETFEGMHFVARNGVGQFDIGIYDANGNLLASKGSTAMALGVQPFTFAKPIRFPAGKTYYAALVFSSNGSDFLSIRTGSQIELQTRGFASIAAALPLPNPATFATATATGLFVPWIALRVAGG